MPFLIWFSKVHLKPFCSLSDVVASTTALNTSSSTAMSTWVFLIVIFSQLFINFRFFCWFSLSVSST